MSKSEIPYLFSFGLAKYFTQNFIHHLLVAETMSNYTNISTKIQEFEKQSLERTNKNLRENVAASYNTSTEKERLRSENEASKRHIKGVMKKMKKVTLGEKEYYVENGIYTPVAKESSFEKEGGTYRLEGEGEYLIPNLELTMNEKPIGKYGSLRRKHLMENNMILYESLSIQGQLHQHLVDINEQANKRMEIMTKKLMEQYGVTEELKAEDQMKWIQEVNNIRAMAEEVILREMIYV